MGVRESAGSRPLKESMLEGTWMDYAACRGLAVEEGTFDTFFPNRGESTKEARTMCRMCPVRTSCLDFALRNNIQAGVFGGTSDRERRMIRRGRRRNYDQFLSDISPALDDVARSMN